MSGLAKYLLAQGYAVSGSDLAANEETEALKRAGADIYTGSDETHVRFADCIVYTDAISSDDRELSAAKRQKIPCLSRMELLGKITSDFDRVIAVAGSHGKTSTTAMCAHVLYEAKKVFTAHIGGRDAVFDNFYAGGKEIFLTEACEYKKNLLRFPYVTTAVLLNCDKDHLECYRNFEDLKETFAKFLSSGERALANFDDESFVRPVRCAGFAVKNEKAAYRAVDIRQEGERYRFTVTEEGKKAAEISLAVCGGFHIYNALACYAAMRQNGVEREDIARGLGNFRGVLRRFETVGKFCGATLVCDYAHHPTEIAKTVAAAQKAARGRVTVVFQPHTYSRTKLLMEEFVSVFSRIDAPIFYPTFAAREAYDEAGSAEELHKRVKKSLYAGSKEELKQLLCVPHEKGEIILFLGAGDIYYIGKEMAEEG